jgi:hypothetical protein
MEMTLPDGSKATFKPWAGKRIYVTWSLCSRPVGYIDLAKTEFTTTCGSYTTFWKLLKELGMTMEQVIETCGK